MRGIEHRIGARPDIRVARLAAGEVIIAGTNALEIAESSPHHQKRTYLMMAMVPQTHPIRGRPDL